MSELLWAKLDREELLELLGLLNNIGLFDRFPELPREVIWARQMVAARRRDAALAAYRAADKQHETALGAMLSKPGSSTRSAEAKASLKLERAHRLFKSKDRLVWRLYELLQLPQPAAAEGHHHA